MEFFTAAQERCVRVLHRIMHMGSSTYTGETYR